MSTPDDSALIHGKTPYDPQKAHEYYMRNRKIKGRTSGVVETPDSRRPSGSTTSSKSRPRADRVYKREQLEAQKELLEKRLDRLRDILDQKVKAAKARSGVETPVDTKTTPAEKAAKNEAAKNEADTKDKPLTATQKKEKAAKARKEYKKENGGATTLSTEVAQLQRQIADIRDRITAALQDAREKSAPPNSQTATNGR